MIIEKVKAYPNCSVLGIAVNFTARLVMISIGHYSTIYFFRIRKKSRLKKSTKVEVKDE